MKKYMLHKFGAGIMAVLISAAASPSAAADVADEHTCNCGMTSYYGISAGDYPEYGAASLSSEEEYIPSAYSSSDGYNALSDVEKTVYSALYNRACEIDTNAENYGFTGTLNYGSFTRNIYYMAPKSGSGWIEVPAIPVSDFKRVYVAFAYDNPQFFWLGNTYSYYKLTNDDGVVCVKSVALSASSEEYGTGSSRLEAKEKIMAEVDTVITQSAKYANEYSKEWYVHDYICNKTVYDENVNTSLENLNAHNISGVFVDGVCVCEAYAKATQLLLNAMDIDVKYISGIGNGGGHAWNQVELGGNWYNLDVTWDDLSSGYCYEWFNKTDDEFPDHFAWQTSDPYVYPAEICSSSEYSYVNHDSNFALNEDSGNSGDVNTDGEVNIKDVTFLKRKISGWDVEIDEAAADVNGDGNVDIKDATILTRYINGWDVTLS